MTMRTYIIKKDRVPIATLQAQNKEDLRKKVSEKLPPYKYFVETSTGSPLYWLDTTDKGMKRAAKKRPFIPKEQYDELYYFLEEHLFKQYLQGKRPQDMIYGGKRYDTLQEARKGALAKSNRLLESIYPVPITLYIFKGGQYLGHVETAKMMRDANFDGTWAPKEYPKDWSPILKDGSIGVRPKKVRGA